MNVKILNRKREKLFSLPPEENSKLKDENLDNILKALGKIPVKSLIFFPKEGTILEDAANALESSNPDIFSSSIYILDTIQTLEEITMARQLKGKKELPPLKDEDLMPSGKHKGILMEDVPAKYLLHIYKSSMSNTRVDEYITANLEIIKEQAEEE